MKRWQWWLAILIGLWVAPAVATQASAPQYATATQPVAVATTPGGEPTKLINQATYRLAKQQVQNGTTYQYLVSATGQAIGYAKAGTLKITRVAQGAWVKANGYARTNKTATAWQTFHWTGARRLAKGTAVKLTGVYYHQNGSAYYSVANTAGKWLGYVNAGSLKLLASPWSAEQADHRIVTVTKNWSAYADLNFHKTGSVYQRTYRSIGRYRHVNGYTYLALADQHNKLVGYINAGAVTVAKDSRGVALKDRGYVLPKTGANAYTSINRTQIKTRTSALAARPAQVRCAYRTLAGELWYSLYDRYGHWLGYAPVAQLSRTSAQGRYQTASGYVTTTKKGYRLWANFNFNRGLSTSTTAYQRTYKIVGVYHHFNGDTYYSLRDGKNHWVGYVNAGNATKASKPQGVWLAYRHAMVISRSHYTIWRTFFGKSYGTTVAGRHYTVTGRYRHLNGAWYVSLYSGKTWLGYVNAQAVKMATTVHNYLRPSQSYAYPNARAASFNIEVDLSSQRVYLKYGSKRVYTMYCSSGIGNSTPRGHFRIQERGYSFYNGSEKMGAHYWTSFYQHGVYLFHSVPTDRYGHYIKSQTTQLGVRPMSHGCIRLSVPDAKWINTHVKTGTKVYIHQ